MEILCRCEPCRLERREPAPPSGIFAGLVVGLPLGILAWAAILYTVVNAGTWFQSILQWFSR